MQRTTTFAVNRIPGGLRTALLASGIAVLVAACRTTPLEEPASVPTGTTAAAVARARADSVRRPYTAADIHFMSGMIGHHAQAIAMSRLADANGARESVRRLAERIVTAQQDEIAIMQQWLRDRLQSVPEASAGHATMHHGAMPGMLTAAQMQELAEARGTAFDRLFLRYMIQHHRGALAMVKELFATPGAAQDETVFKLAADIDAEQTTEVGRMVRMLTEMLGEPTHR